MRVAALLGVRVSSSVKSVYHSIRSQYDPTLISTRVNGQYIIIPLQTMFLSAKNIPFALSGVASLVGSTGVITFDKKAYNLRGAGCQYLLARDFLNQDFAVAVNYEESSGTKSIIFTDGADQVEIKGEQVLVNNKLATALPLKLKTIKVQRLGDVVTVKRSSGVVLECNVVKDVCTLELSPFYSGRTMGLWGTFSNEHADDMTEPNGKVYSLSPY